jgi:hypothetical protein
MKNDSGFPGSATTSQQPLMTRILGWPISRLGWQAVWLGVAFMILWIINALVLIPLSTTLHLNPLVYSVFTILMLLVGLAAVIVGLIAIIIRHERSWLNFLAILPGLYVLISLLIELL